jgi:hypothetical protein
MSIMHIRPAQAIKKSNGAAPPLGKLPIVNACAMSAVEAIGGARQMAQKQSPGYPNITLEKAIRLAGQIFEKDRKNPIDRGVAAQHIGYRGPSGAADKTLASLAHYGLVEKAGKGALRVTQTLVDILYPESEEDRVEALRAAALSPAIFREIRERFQDGVPSEGALKGWLMRENFLDRAISPLTKSYLETMHYLEQSKAFESGGDTSGTSAESPVRSEILEQEQMHTAHEAAPPSLAPFPVTELNKINAEIKGDTVRVSALLNREGLEKLEKKIAALKDFLSED